MTDTDLVQLYSSIKHTLFPRPFERLAVSGYGLVGAEIGVYRGLHAKSLLDHLDIRQLFLIDPYEMYAGYTDGRLHYGVDQPPLSDARAEAARLLSDMDCLVTWLYMKSSEAIAHVPRPIDFCYVDGNHDENYVRADLIAYWPLIRPGGVMGGHDFYNGYCREHDGVVRAVSQFATMNNLALQVELPDWWIVKE